MLDVLARIRTYGPLQPPSSCGLSTLSRSLGNFDFRAASRPPSPYQILCGDRPIGKLELETSLDKAIGNDAAALQRQFSFCAQKNRTYFQHPLRCREPNACAPCLSQSPHEMPIPQRMRP